jgi:uncharacterized protein YigE (DUF2233 family)
MKMRAMAKAATSILMAFLVVGCGADSISQPVAEGPIAKSGTSTGTCRAAVFEGSEFTRCSALPGKQQLKMALNDSNGTPLRSLRRLEQSLANKSANILFAMNGGMFDDEGRPIGYYVENGKRIKKLNQKAGGGNFHLLPNGVFFGDPSSWQIRTTDYFSENVTTRPDFATQSGPMLVIDGKLHPKIAVNGTSVNIRNAVGIDADGRAHFVISEVPVSFGKLARFMRDELKCANALYLDGAVSALWYPVGDRQDAGASLGPLIVVTKAAKEPQQ